jgi:transcriptional regulator with XRE-family HTH domain
MITKLKIVVDKSGLKQRHLANLVGVDESILSRMIRGVIPMPKDVRKGLAKALRVPVADISADEVA